MNEFKNSENGNYKKLWAPGPTSEQSLHALVAVSSVVGGEVFYQIKNRKSLRLINRKSIVRYSAAHKLFVLI